MQKVTQIINFKVYLCFLAIALSLSDQNKYIPPVVKKEEPKKAYVLRKLLEYNYSILVMQSFSKSRRYMILRQSKTTSCPS